ncbi:ATPase [Sandarakinorhabdus cyanobacteriorum]|uniref:ATPase n=1 Tax=Sandarakinorhabdus cyanobacteriorum TaxID=1981098 RepID=A0A255YHR2_9SPHN|nr:division plane positioning ATPase MipZ [Sandarakinorhabdus cyanobacteriorum]OYQ28739.1 ATPase [Sandarakinorhabdus cyanobacteriorum]
MGIIVTAHVIVLANEKGGTGKSTTAVHIGVALALAGHRTALIDLDSRQRTSTRYLENRWHHAQRHGLTLPVPDVAVVADGDGAVDELALRFSQASVLDFIVVDSPGRDSALARAAMARADTLVTPINDSFVDFDLIGEVDGETFAVNKPSFYAELVWEARTARAREQGKQMDWVVLRNRLSALDARNKQRVGAALDGLAKRIGFRVLPGLSERVIYREFFPRGLTLLDRAALTDFSLSHVAARNELRALIAGLNLPGGVDLAA